MKIRYEIEKDKILGRYIVWECYTSCKVHVFDSKLKKECVKWIEKKEKR